MNWKWNYLAALFFAVLAVVAAWQHDWVWFGIDAAAAVGSVVIAEKARRRERRRQVEMVRSLMAMPSPLTEAERIKKLEADGG